MSQKISTEAYKLVIWSLFYRFWKVIFSVFINVYLWKETGDIQLLALFNIITLISHMLWFLWWVQFVKKWYAHQISSIAFLWLIFIFSFLYIFIWTSKEVYWFFWIVFWLFNGMYYSAQNVRIFSATTFKNRWNFQGVRKSLDGAAKMFFPLLIWVIISFFNIQFAIICGIIMYLAGLCISHFPDIHLKKSLPYKTFLSELKGNKKIYFTILSAFFFQLAFAVPVLELIISLSIFSKVWTEISLWASLSVIWFASIILMYWFWKFVHYKHYNKAIIFVNILYILALMLFVYSTELSHILIAASLITGSIWMYGLIFWVISNNSLHCIKNYKEHNANFNITKECAYFAGWIIWYFIIYFSWDLSQESLKILMYSFATLSILSSIFLIKIWMHQIDDAW